MRMKSVIFILLILPICFLGQVNLDSSLNTIFQKFPDIDSGKVYFRIPISFHIVKNTETPQTLFTNDIKKIIDTLNKKYFHGTGIAFYVHSIVFINSGKYLKINVMRESFKLIWKKRFNGVINCYYVNILEFDLLNKNYLRGLTIQMPKSIIISYGSHKSTLSHEIGHYLGLSHPHKNWKLGRLFQESVERNKKVGLIKKKYNCQKRGDKLCDTPAEPDLRYFTDKNCNYIGNITDAWGKPYNPHTNNIMSFLANSDCRKKFTKSQIAKMIFTLSKSKYAEVYQDTLHIFDFYEPDNYINQANQLKFNNLQEHTFHFIPYKNNFIVDPYDCFILPTIDSTASLIVNTNKELTITFFDANYKVFLKTKLKNTSEINLTPEFSNLFFIISLEDEQKFDKVCKYTILLKN